MGSSEGKEPEPISVGSAIGDLANVSHQKGDVGLITITTDKVEACLSASNSLWANFFFLMVGIAVTVFIALKSGGIEAGSKPVFWLAFYGAVIFALFFGIGTFFGESKKRKLRRELIRESSQLKP